jgi:hypothetical protein
MEGMGATRSMGQRIGRWWDDPVLDASQSIFSDEMSLTTND